MHEQLLHIDPSSLDFSNSVILLNRSKRFVLPIPALPNGGEELRYPKGHEKAGEPIYTNKDGSVQKGIVFANHTDSGWQGVQGNGKEAIIINDLSAKQAEQVQAKINEVAPDITKITAAQVLDLLQFIRDEIGLVDMFDKDLASIAKQMRFVDPERKTPELEKLSSFMGYMEVSKDTEHMAIRVERGISIQGPVLQKYPNGAVIVNSGRHVWGIDKQVCLANWVLKNWDGSEVRIGSLENDVPEYLIK